VHAIATAVQDKGPAAERYSRFHAAVSRAQLLQWLENLGTGLPLIDVSGPAAQAAEVAASAGHSVLRVVQPGAPVAPNGDYGLAGRPRTLVADTSGLEFLPDGCADGVIAEDRTLSRQLAAEALVSEIARVLRPGGSVLACVDSLTLGMAVLAEQHHWPHLVDVPNADVVLIPWPDGTITRCYGAEQLRELFTGNGLEVSWIRPRTVFSRRTVSYLLARDPASFGRLVSAELSARADDSVGAHLIISAVLPGAVDRLPSSAVSLGLAGNAPLGCRTCLEPQLRHWVGAIQALAIVPGVDPGQRRHDLRPLGHRRLHRRLVTVGLREIGPSVTRLRGPPTGQRMFTPQNGDRPVEFVSHFL
jgi:hypothetical protein